MSKEFFLSIYGIISFGFLNNILFSTDILYVLFALWGIFGFLCFKQKKHLFMPKNIWPILWLLLLLLPGIMYVNVIYNQDFGNSLIALRQFIGFIFVLDLLYIMPTNEEINKSFKFLAYLSVFFALVSYMKPEIFASEKALEHFEWSQDNDMSDIIAVWPGIWALRIYFFITVQQLIEKKQTKNVFVCLFFLFCLTIQQNRSTLIFALPLFFYALLKSKNRFRYPILLFVFCIGVTYGSGIIYSLLNESMSQVNDVDYNRWQAFYFFLLEFKSNIYTFLFGHGVPCINSSYLNELLYAQTTRLAFISDIGMLGTYFYYGFIFCSIIYYYILKSFFNVNIPMYIKFISLWIICVPTIHHIGLGEMTGFVVFGYIFYMNIYYGKRQNRRVNYNY